MSPPINAIPCALHIFVCNLCRHIPISKQQQQRKKCTINDMREAYLKFAIFGIQFMSNSLCLRSLTSKLNSDYVGMRTIRMHIWTINKSENYSLRCEKHSMWHGKYVGDHLRHAHVVRGETSVVCGPSIEIHCKLSYFIIYFSHLREIFT